MRRVTIGSNIASLSVQRKLADTTSVLSKTFEALSSGMRINGASDDAAGLAVAESLNADSRVYTQGIRNLNDGQSLLAIADGATAELGSILIRIKELSVQAANGIYTTKQRYALDSEAQALAKEFNRIARTTEFNGRKIFDYDFGQLRIQAGFGLDGSVLSGLGGGIGNGTFDSGSAYTVAVATSRAVATADFNGDGILDIVGSDNANETITFLRGNGDGTFSTGSAVTVSGSNLGMYNFEVGDFNSDGKVDLLSVNYTDGSLGIMLGNGDGTFSSATLYASATNTQHATVADFNGDGIQDLAASGSNVGVYVYLGRGDGTFGTASVLSTGTSYAVTSGDFNNDGLIDLTTGQSVYLGAGNGTFAAATALTGSTTTQQVEVGDFNGDGIQDIATANQSVDQIRVFLGRGNGTFNSCVNYTSGTGGYRLVIGDFNGDGNQDIANSSATNGVHLLLGTGSGTFAAATQTGVTSGAQTTLIAGDYNQDGVLDLTRAGGTSVTNHLGVRFDGIAALQSFSLRSKFNAKQALMYMNEVLTRVNKQRGQVGAFQSRLDIASKNLATTSENYKAARSRIIDADIAQETSTMVRANILQRAGSSVLAQANVQPRLALRLLEGI